MNPKLLLSLASAVAMSGSIALGAASFVDVSLPGSTSYDGWEALNNANFPVGSYPGTAAWPSAIGSNSAGSGDATLNKVTGSGYTSTTGGSYIYSTLSGANAANTSPDNVVGTFSITDLNPVAGIETVVFQIHISFWANVGTPFPTGSVPLLYINGSSQTIPATYTVLNYRGEFSSEYGSGTADFWGFQWDLSEIEEPITSIQVVYSVTNHAQVYGLRLDQSDTFAQVIPEPSVGVIFCAAAGMAGLRRRRK